MSKHLEIVLYPEDGWDEQKIVAEIAKRKSIEEYVIALHDQDLLQDGNPVKPHYHVYLNFGKTNWKPDQVAKWFGIPQTLVRKITSDKSGNNTNLGKYFVINYYTHSNYPDKHQYSPADFVSNFDVSQYLEKEKERQVRVAEKKNRRAEIDSYIERCVSGEITRYNYSSMIPEIVYSRNKPVFERVWEQLDHRHWMEQKSRRNCEVIWLYGPAGTGKTQMALLFADQLEMAAYISNPGNDPLDGYQNEPIIVLDDIRPNAPFTYEALLKMLDPYTLAGVHSRYKDKYPQAKYIFVTSVYSPEDLYKESYIGNVAIDSIIQLLRRIHQTWYFTSTKIEISEYDESKEDFVNIATKDNPVPAYIATQIKNQPSKVKPEDVASAIVAKYSPSP